MAHAAGGDHQHALMARPAGDGGAQGLAEGVQPLGGGDRVADHVHRDGRHRPGPGRVRHIREPGIDAVVHRQLLADGHVEAALAHQAGGQMPAEVGVAHQRWEGPQAEALVRLGEFLGHADGQGRIGVEFKVVQVIVVDHHHLVGGHARQPVLHRPRTVEPGPPLRRPALGQALVVLVAHRGGVGDAKAADDRRHQPSPGRPETRRGQAA